MSELDPDMQGALEEAQRLFRLQQARSMAKVLGILPSDFDL